MASNVCLMSSMSCLFLCLFLLNSLLHSFPNLQEDIFFEALISLELWKQLEEGFHLSLVVVFLFFEYLQWDLPTELGT